MGLRNRPEGGSTRPSHHCLDPRDQVSCLKPKRGRCNDGPVVTRKTCIPTRSGACDWRQCRQTATPDAPQCSLGWNALSALQGCLCSVPALLRIHGRQLNGGCRRWRRASFFLTRRNFPDILGKWRHTPGDTGQGTVNDDCAGELWCNRLKRNLA